jgi:hypothetical protein
MIVCELAGVCYGTHIDGTLVLLLPTVRCTTAAWHWLQAGPVVGVGGRDTAGEPGTNSPCPARDSSSFHAKKRHCCCPVLAQLQKVLPTLCGWRDVLRMDGKPHLHGGPGENDKS